MLQLKSGCLSDTAENAVCILASSDLEASQIKSNVFAVGTIELMKHYQMT